MNLIEEIRVECVVYPTEDKDKILKVFYRYFPATKFTLEKFLDPIRGIELYRLVGISKNIIALDYIRRELGKRKSKDIFKKILKQGEFPDGFIFFLNKQALMKGKIYLMSGEVKPALGLVKITIRTNNKDMVKAWLLL